MRWFDRWRDWFQGAREPRVLVVCVANVCRSPMAEGLAREILGQRIYVDSAGLSTETLDGFAVAAMAELQTCK